MPSDRDTLIVIGAMFTAIGTMTTALRFLSHYQGRRRYGYDDTAMYTAYVCSIAFAAASYASVGWGVGLPLSEVQAGWGPKCIQSLYAIEIFYFVAQFAIKMAVICLYLRLSAPSEWALGPTLFRRSTSALQRGSVLLFWILCVQFAVTILVVLLQCYPIQKYWNPERRGQCVNITAFLYSAGAFTIVTDVVMLALPVSTVWKVNLRKREKVGLVCAFLAGGISTLASFVRLYSIRIYTESRERIRDAAPINTWSFIEINIGICCASACVFKCMFMNSQRVSQTAAQ